MRDIIIADIHGCVRAYEALLYRLQPNEAEDRLILLGDLFDRGPDSWEVFQTVVRQADAFGERFILLRGNHEDFLLQPRLTLSQRMVWNRVGRQTTVQSFHAHGAKMEDSIPFLNAHCRMYYKGNGFQCAHAGVLADPIEVNDANTLLHDHHLVLENRYTGPLTVTGHIALARAAYFAGDRETIEFIPQEAFYPLPQTGVICIDTGCGKGGSLTAMVVENGRFALCSVPETC